MYNIGIIGLGDNGTMHLRGFDRLEETRVAAICDRKTKARERALALLDDPDVVSTSSWKKVCRMKEIDAICVSVPTYLHADVTVLALENGKDVFLEKPICPTMEETDTLILKAFRTDRIVQVGLVYRYCNLYRTLGRMVERGDFGDVMMAFGKEYRDNFPVQWFFETEKSGGALLDKDCHHFDLFSWFIRRKPVKVYAMGGQHVVRGKSVKINCHYAPDRNLMIKRPDIIDHAFVIVQYDNGALANLGLCMYQKEPLHGLEIGINGSNGAHAVARRDVVLNAGGGPLGDIAEVPVDYEKDNCGIGHIGADRQHVEFVECMKTRAMPYANLLLARESMVISLAAERSVREGREVLIEEFDNPKINKLIEKHCMEVYRDTPAPLPPPRPKKEKKKSREKKIIDTFVDLVRLLMGKRPRSEALPFGPEAFEQAAASIADEKRFGKLAKGLEANISFHHSGEPPVFVSIKDGKLAVADKAFDADETKIVFTESGWQGLQTGDSIQKLLVTGQVRAEGKIDHLKPYTEALIELTKALGKV